MTFSFATIARENALRTPDAPALSFEGHTVSFSELDTASSRVANALRADGVGACDRVAILSKNVPEFFEVVLGCSKMGAVVVGLNWRLAAPEIEAIVADATPTLLVANRDHAHLVTPSVLASPGLTRVVWIGEEFDAWRDAASPADPMYVSRPDEVALLLYTSGTTGAPKGVMLTNENMSFTPAMAATAWSIDHTSVNLVAMPLFHIGGIGYGLSAMCFGGHTVLMREVDPASILRSIERYRVTHAFFVPAVIQMLLAAPEISAIDVSSLRLLVYGAAPIGEELLRRAIAAFGCGFTQAYGMTETAGTVVVLPATDHDPGGPRAHLLRACGRPLPWVEARLVNPQTLSDADAGDVGEIWLRCGGVTPGYWNQPTESEAAITAEGWLRTGDAAYRDDAGYLFLFDRFKDMIVSGAENVYPAEVENALGCHPAVSEVAVIGVPDERWGETVKAFVVLRPGQAADAATLINFARQRLAKYKCPTSIDFVDSLPRNASGKLLKKELRAAHWQGLGRGVN